MILNQPHRSLSSKHYYNNRYVVIVTVVVFVWYIGIVSLFTSNHNNPTFLLLLVEAKTTRTKISDFVNETVNGIIHIIQKNQNQTTTPSSSSTPRRVWLTYNKGQYTTMLAHMEYYRTTTQQVHTNISNNNNNNTLYPILFDFPALHSMVIMATDDEINTILSNTTISMIYGTIHVTDDPLRYPMTIMNPNYQHSSSFVRNGQSQQQNHRTVQQGQTIPYGIPLTQVDQLWSTTGLSGNNITVCVIDSGLDINHVDLSTTTYTGNSLVFGSEWTMDTSGHGTHVTGIIAATNNNIGIVGVAPNVKIHTVDVFGSDGSIYASAIIDAAYKCRDNNAKIISMSLGGEFYSEQENTLFTELYTRNGILSIAAAGNAGSNIYSFPASYDNVLSVGAIDDSKQLASFSQYNDRVDIVAPGVGIWSLLPTTGTCEICSQIGQYTYGILDGTSQATPYVSGIAALLWSYNPSLSVDMIRNAIISSGEDLGSSGRDNSYGNGLIAALDANNVLTSSTPTGTPPPPTPTATPPPTSGIGTNPPISDPNESPISSCVTASLIFQTDEYPYETFVSLIDLYSNTVLWYGGVDMPYTDYILTADCLLVNGCYKFQFFDTNGDGICCLYGQGYFQLSIDDVPILTGSDFGYDATYFLGDGCQI